MGGTSPPWRAAEVMELLGFGDRLTYQRLQDLGALASELSPLEQPSRTSSNPRAWRLYTPADVARIAVILSVNGGRAALEANLGRAYRRLNGIGQVGAVGRRLLGPRYGLRDPLLEVDWIRQGRELLVIIDGDLVDPMTDQILASFGVAAMPELVNDILSRSDPTTRNRILRSLLRRRQ